MAYNRITAYKTINNIKENVNIIGENKLRITLFFNIPNVTTNCF